MTTTTHVPTYWCHTHNMPEHIDNACSSVQLQLAIRNPDHPPIPFPTLTPPIKWRHYRHIVIYSPRVTVYHSITIYESGDASVYTQIDSPTPTPTRQPVTKTDVLRVLKWMRYMQTYHNYTIERAIGETLPHQYPYRQAIKPTSLPTNVSEN